MTARRRVGGASVVEATDQAAPQARPPVTTDEPGAGVATTTTYREAVREAIREAMLADDRVFLMGEDVGMYGGCFGVSMGLLEQFGPDRVRDTPLSESAFVGAGIGAALGGMRPIVEVMTVNFSLLALDQIMNTAAALQHMSGGQFQVPLVIRMTTGAGRQLAAQHSHSLEGWYAHIPGIRIVAPATVVDARGMLATALADPDPVLVFEHGGLYNASGELPADGGPVDLDTAAIRRPGADVTLITYGGTLATTLAAAEALADEGVDAEVIDLRTLRPLDDATILGIGAADPSGRGGRRGLAQRQPVGGDLRADHRAARSTSSMHPSGGCAARRSRCPTPGTSSSPRCRASTAIVAAARRAMRGEA